MVIRAQKIPVLINPRSGSNQGQKLRNFLEKSAHCEHFVVTSIEWEILDQQIASLGTQPLVLIAGGDGTFSSILPKFIGTSTQVGLIPLGLGNDLAQEIAQYRVISLNQFITRGSSESEATALPFTIWQIQDLSSQKILSYFTNYLSVGFSAEIVRTYAEKRITHPLTNKFLQRLRYATIGAQNWNTQIPAGISLHNESSSDNLLSQNRTACLIFSNISSWMGLARVQSSNPTDQLLEATCARTPFDYARMLVARRVPSLTLPLLGQASSWHLSEIPEETNFNRDGERFNISTPAIKITVAGKVLLYGVFKPF